MGMMHLCKYMPDPKDARRQIADPANEPDLYAISRMYPVPPVIKSNLAETEQIPPTAAAAAAVAISAAAPSTHQKIGMDRNAALAEIKSLRARLASDALPSSPLAGSPEPPAKRQAVLASGLLGQTQVSQLARMPQPFPTQARGLSQLEAILQRNAIVSAIRKQQQQDAQQQQQQLQDLQVQQQIQELHAQQQLEDIQAQRQLQELKARQTLQQLQAQRAMSEFQEQQALRELQLAKVAQQLQQQQQLLGLRNHLALQGLHQQQQQAPAQPGLAGLNNAASVGEYLRRTQRFP